MRSHADVPSGDAARARVTKEFGALRQIRNPKVRAAAGATVRMMWNCWRISMAFCRAASIGLSYEDLVRETRRLEMRRLPAVSCASLRRELPALSRQRARDEFGQRRAGAQTRFRQSLRTLAQLRALAGAARIGAGTGARCLSGRAELYSLARIARVMNDRLPSQHRMRGQFMTLHSSATRLRSRRCWGRWRRSGCCSRRDR